MIMKDKEPEELATLSEFLASCGEIKFSDEFWANHEKLVRDENERYAKECRALKIDPVSGKSTMSWEDRNRPFTM